MTNVQRNGTTPLVSALSTTYAPIRFDPKDRRTFIGGSDARIILGDDEAQLVWLWREKRGETDPEDFQIQNTTLLAPRPGSGSPRTAPVCPTSETAVPMGRP